MKFEKILGKDRKIKERVNLYTVSVVYQPKVKITEMIVKNSSISSLTVGANAMDLGVRSFV